MKNKNINHVIEKIHFNKIEMFWFWDINTNPKRNSGIHTTAENRENAEALLAYK